MFEIAGMQVSIVVKDRLAVRIRDRWEWRGDDVDRHRHEIDEADVVQRRRG